MEKSMKEKCRILFAEDHAILRDGLRALLEAEHEFMVVGEVDNGRDALYAVSSLSPQLVLMDLSMPNTNGTEAIRNIKRRFPETKIVALTVHKAEEYVRATLKAGADGYVLKDDSRAELMVALRSVLNGKTYLSPNICDSVVSGYLGGNGPKDQTPSWNTLTHREREVIKLIAEGKRNREIAGYLSVSLKTVEKHRSNLMKKLDLHSASALTAYAIENRLVTN